MVDGEKPRVTLADVIVQKRIAQQKHFLKLKWLTARFKAFISKNFLLLAVIFGWFAFGAVAFVYYGFPIKQIPSLALYLIPPLPYTIEELGVATLEANRHFWNMYYSYGPNIVIPAVLSIIIYNLLEGFHPEVGCRRLAKAMRDHTIVLGYTKFGKRIVSVLKARGEPYVVVESDRVAVEELLRHKEPVVVDEIDEVHSLKLANISKARAVIVADDDPKVAMLATKRVRELNPKCMLIVRCFVDELVEVIESLGADIVISSWRKDADDVFTFMDRARTVENMKQLTVVTRDRIGILAEITELFGKEGINIESISEEDFKGDAVIQLLTNNVAQAKKLLISRGFNVTESDVLIVTLTDKPGELAKLLKRLAEKDVDIESMYLLSRSHPHTTLAIKVDKPRQAKLILKETIHGV